MIESEQPTEFDPAKYNFKALAWRSLVVIIVSMFMASLFFGVVFYFIAPQSNVIMLGLITFFGMLLPAVFIAYYSPFTLEAALRLRPFHFFHLIIGLAGLLACLGINIGIQSIFFRLMPGVYENVLNTFDSGVFDELVKYSASGIASPQFALATFTIAVLPAIGEEFFFRGLFLRTLEQWMTPMRAIIISSAIFAALHINPFNLFTIFALGALLAAISISTRSIFPAMIFHFLFNFASVLAYFIDPAATDSTKDLLQLLPAITILIVSLVTLYLIIIYFLRSRSLEASGGQN
ncbi:MAG: lysostaphin resistance A-like protein [Chloroflexota bacterium]